MPAHVARLFVSHRIGVSRVLVAALALILLSVESAQEGTVLSALLFLFGLVLVGIATAGRLWCSLYISGYKNRELVTCGPYSLCRNPLYFFSFLGFVGIGFTTETFSVGLASILIFAMAYPAIIRHEEAFLMSKFGEAFAEYCSRTPRFFPSLRSYREPLSYMVDSRVFRRSVGDVLWFVWLVGLVELVESLHEHHVLGALFRLP